MGYYSAGGGWAAPDFTQAPSPSFNVATAGRGVAASSAAPSAAAGGGSYHKRTRVLNLTALRRAFNRVDKAARIAHTLFSFKKAGIHGMRQKHHRKKRRA